MTNRRPPRLAASLIRRLSVYNDEYCLAEDLNDEFERLVSSQGHGRAVRWYWAQSLKCLPAYVRYTGRGSLAMFSNFLLTAWRQMKRNMVFSAITLMGLTLGLTCFMIIMTWVQFETSFDTFHEQSDRIYRILHSSKKWEGLAPHGCGPLGPALKADYPFIEEAVRMFGGMESVLKTEDRSFRGRLLGADSSIFKIFDFPLIQAATEPVLRDSSSIVLTESMADKLFPEQNALGQMVTFEWWGRWIPFTVTAVMADVPTNSHLQFDYLLPFDFVTRSGMSIDDWGVVAYHTYVLLRQGSNPSSVIEQISGTMQRYRPASDLTLHLEPLERIHLYHYGGGGPIVYITIFSVVGLLILGIACINYMNLTTARALNRIREIGLRKVVGSSRRQLMAQFLIESVFYSFLAFLGAVVAAWLLLPAINALLETGARFSLSPTRTLGWLAMVLFTGLMAGSYPAVFLSRFRPIMVLRSSAGVNPGNPLPRRVLVVAQYVVTIVFILASLVVQEQLGFVREKDLGLERHHVLNLEIRGKLGENYGTIKEEILRNPHVLSVCLTNFAQNKKFGSDNLRWEGQAPDQSIPAALNSVDYDFAETFDLEVKYGRFFSRDISTDRNEAFVINESAVAAFGYDDPLGKWLKVPMPFGEREGRIVGVIEDYNFDSLHREIRPLVLVIEPYWFSDVYVRMDGVDLPETMAAIQETIQRYAPDYPYAYKFLDEQLDALYKTELTTGRLLQYGTGITVIIASLGLFGLALYTTQRRLKEIGVRKVLGANSLRLIVQLTGDFSRWILVANLFAWPLAYWLMDNWLEQFAFRIRLGIGPFLAATLLTMAIGVLTVIGLTTHAARTNPAECLRSE